MLPVALTSILLNVKKLVMRVMAFFAFPLAAPHMFRAVRAQTLSAETVFVGKVAPLCRCHFEEFLALVNFVIAVAAWASAHACGCEHKCGFWSCIFWLSFSLLLLCRIVAL